MRFGIRGTAFLLLAVITACSERGALNPQLETFDAPLQATVNTVHNGIRISEFHYDNTGTDAGEAVEVSAPADADLTGYAIVLYNGASGGAAVYDTDLLSSGVTTTCTGGTRKVVVVSYAPNGIQNGSPDGIALVAPGNVIVEFLSYEGDMPGATQIRDANNAPVSQNGTEAIGSTIQRLGAANIWQKVGPTAANRFGACNDLDDQPPAEVASVTVTPSTATVIEGATVQLTATAFSATNQVVAGVGFTWSSSAPLAASVSSTGLVTGLVAGSASILATTSNGTVGIATVTVTEPPPPPDLPTVRFSEIHYDNFGTDVGEAIEIEGPANTDLTGWSIALYNGDVANRRVYNTLVLSGTIAATCTNLVDRGILHFEYPSNGIQNGSPDGFALVDASGNLVEFLSYEGTFTAVDGPAAGQASLDIGVAQSSSPLGQTLQRKTNGRWEGPKASTVGGCNSGGPITRLNIVSFTGRVSTDPALPIGFEDQLFAEALNPTTGEEIETTFTWSSETPTIAGVDADGVVRALAAGTAIIRATGADGSTGTHVLPTRVATASTTAQYGNHVEFGVPTDGDASDDFIVTRPQFVSSFNGAKGIPNWAAYNLEATHFGNEDRCDCFTYDPALPAAYTRYTTADYTGAGAFHRYGIDRGHLVRSFDREAGSLDNAVTYYFTNIVPQAAHNNQGPWSAMEDSLGKLAQTGNYEIYIVAGASGSKGTLKNEGIITIPTAMWKVAVIMPRNQGLANVDSPDDVKVIAAVMPNDSGIRTVDWRTYQTSVDAVEALSGYNLLDLLPDAIEFRVENNAIALLDDLIATGALNRGVANSLQVKIDAAMDQLERGHRETAGHQLQAILNEVDALVQSGRLTATAAAPLRQALQLAIAAI